MADKIKKFFARKKDEAKFKLKVGNMGAGRKLNAEAETAGSTSSTKDKSSKPSYVPPKRKELSEEARTAAAAAMARIQKKDTKEFNTSLAAIKAQVKRELEAEKKLKEQLEKREAKDASTTDIENVNRNLACQGVFFRCPLISSELLSKNEWKVKIKEFLYQQLEEEPGLTACLIIQNCNPREKAEACVETLSKYIENLMNNPEEEKYHKIRMNNRIFYDKVRFVEGALEFLNAAGFREDKIDEEDYLIWSDSNLPDSSDLQMLFDALHNAEPISLELDRNIQVLLPSQARKVELPPDFYRLSAEEIKREQQLKSEALENTQVLKTKAMREKEELRTINKYRFALIRIKFPNGIYLQGTFNVYEKLSDIYEFVQSCLQDEALEFSITAPAGLKFTDNDLDKSLYDLRLIPNTVLIFVPECQISNDTNLLKEELLMLVQTM